MRNLISIIIPFYKKKPFFSKTIKSVLNQSYKNFEIILIYDDISKHDLKFVKKILLKIKKKKIIVNKKNLGVGRSRNIGIKMAKGNFIAFLDADDIWHKNKLKEQLIFMKKNKTDFSYTNYLIIDENEKYIKKINVPKMIKYEDLLYSCNIGLSTVMISAKLKSQIIFPNIKTKEDFVLWLKLSKNYNFLGIQKYLVSWRQGTPSLRYVCQKFKDAFIVYSKYEKFNLFKSYLFVIILSFNFIKKSLLQKYYR